MIPISSSVHIVATINDSCTVGVVVVGAEDAEEAGASHPVLASGVESLASPVHTKVAVDRRRKGSAGEHHHQQTAGHCSTSLFRTPVDVEAEHLRPHFHSYLNEVSLAVVMPSPIHTCSSCRGGHEDHRVLRDSDVPHKVYSR